MSITRGHLPLLIICLTLSFVLPAYAQSEGEQLPGTSLLRPEQAVLIALAHNPGFTEMLSADEVRESIAYLKNSWPYHIYARWQEIDRW